MTLFSSVHFEEMPNGPVVLQGDFLQCTFGRGVKWMNQGCWGLFAVCHMRKCEVGKSGTLVTICAVLQQWTNETCQESLVVYLIAECQTDVLRLPGTYCGVPFVQESGGCTTLTGYFLWSTV